MKREYWILIWLQVGVTGDVYCDLARLHLLHKPCWVDFALGSPDWTVLLNAYTVHTWPAWHLVNTWSYEDFVLRACSPRTSPTWGWSSAPYTWINSSNPSPWYSPGPGLNTGAIRGFNIIYHPDSWFNHYIPSWFLNIHGEMRSVSSLWIKLCSFNNSTIFKIAEFLFVLFQAKRIHWQKV